MDKSGKITVGTVAAIIAALAALFTAWLVYNDADKPLIADVDCVHWKAPQSVVTELRAMDGKKGGAGGSAVDPNRMTGVDANDVCSMYTVTIENKNRDSTKNTQMTILTAVHWEVSWMSTKGPQRKVYSGNQLIPLPDILHGDKVYVKAWSSCKAGRPTENEVRIMQESGDYRLGKIRPVRASMHRLDELISIARSYIIAAVAIVLISVGTILIKRKYFPQNEQTAP